MQEVLLQGDGDSRFATGGETSKPQREAFLATKGAALLMRDGRRVPRYVADEGRGISLDREGCFEQRRLRTPT